MGDERVIGYLCDESGVNGRAAGTCPSRARLDQRRPPFSSRSLVPGVGVTQGLVPWETPADRLSQSGYGDPDGPSARSAVVKEPAGLTIRANFCPTLGIRLHVHRST